MGTKFISGVAGVQAPLIRKTTAFGSKVSTDMDMMRHAEPRYVPAAVMAIIAGLEAEGWGVTMSAPDVTIAANGMSYTRSFGWLTGCDYSNVSPQLANDIMDCMQALGGCP